APVRVRTAYFATDAFTGHSNGLIGHTTSTGVRPSHPTFFNTLRPYSGGRGSNVHAVSVPNSVGTPSSRNTPRDSSFRVITNEFLQYRPHIFATSGSMCPASAPYPTDSLFCAAAIPSDPIIIVVRALANLLLNIDPSHATTPSCCGTSFARNGGKISGRCTCFVFSKYPREKSKFWLITLNSTRSPPRMCRICRSISSTRTSEPILRVPLYPAKSSFSFSPGCHGLLPPSIQRALARSILALTHASRTKSIMQRYLLGPRATADIGTRNCSRG